MSKNWKAGFKESCLMNYLKLGKELGKRIQRKPIKGFTTLRVPEVTIHRKNIHVAP